MSKKLDTTGIVIGRPINGISINGLEYALDEDGNYLHFASVEEAKQFLRNNGAEDEDEIEDCYVFQFHTRCLNCSHEYFLHLSETFVDELGRGYCCPQCDCSFDVM